MPIIAGTAEQKALQRIRIFLPSGKKCAGMHLLCCFAAAGPPCFWPEMNLEIRNMEIIIPTVRIMKSPGLTGAIWSGMPGSLTSFPGWPDISFHHGVPWNSQTDENARQIGILFCGRKEADTGDDGVFLAVNAHWEPHTQTLPKAPGGYRWKLAFHTASPAPFDPEAGMLEDEILFMDARSAAAAVLERCE